MIWLGVAAALEPEAGLHAMTAVGNSEQAPLLFGAGGTVAIDPLPRLHLELGADGGWAVNGVPWFGAGPRLRGFLGDPEKQILSVFAGGGVALDDGPRGLVNGGASLDLGTSGGPRPHVTGQYTWSPGGSQRFALGVGAIFGRKGPPVAPPPPPPEPEPEPMVLAEEGMVWLPGPVCQWLLPDDASAEMTRLGVQLASMNVLSEKSLRDPSGGADLPPPKAEPSPGKVVVVALATDQVEIGGTRVPVVDGLAVSSHPEGRVDVRVVGGGREENWPLGVVPGNAVWVSVEQPQPQRITFGMGSDVIRDAQRAKLAAMLETMGDWSLVVRGSFSPEGSIEKNKALARERAEAVRAAVVEAGFPADRVRTDEPVRPEEGLPPEEQRAAVLIPRERL